MMTTPTCPHCGSERVHRTVERMVHLCANNILARHLAKYLTCLKCQYRWDGITEPLGLPLPIGVVAREEA